MGQRVTSVWYGCRNSRRPGWALKQDSLVDRWGLGGEGSGQAEVGGEAFAFTFLFERGSLDNSMKGSEGTNTALLGAGCLIGSWFSSAEK